MTQFQNLYSLEIEPDSLLNKPYCCCDAIISTCKDNRDQFSLDTCEALCDTYFVLKFSECQNLLPCPVTMMTNISADSDTTTNVNYDFHFIVNSSSIEQVRVWVLYVTKLYTVKNKRWYLWQGGEGHCKRKWTSPHLPVMFTSFCSDLHYLCHRYHHLFYGVYSSIPSYEVYTLQWLHTYSLSKNIKRLIAMGTNFFLTRICSLYISKEGI